MTYHSGVDVTLVSTSRRFPLGRRQKAVDANGEEQTWVYVFNDEAATAFAAGDIVVRDPSATTYLLWGGLIAASGTVFAHAAVIGVAQHAIAAGSYGFILEEGLGVIKNGTANISADTALTSGGDRAGAAIDLAAGAEQGQIALSLAAEATDDTTLSAFIKIP